MKYLVIATILLLVAGCRKDNSCEGCTTANTVQATIIDAGSVAADGCGWLVRIGPATYHPHNLDDAFKIDQRQVTITYQVMPGTFRCGLAAHPYSIIHILSIRQG